MPQITNFEVTFQGTEKNHDAYRGKDCMKKFCQYLRKHVMEKINFEKINYKLKTRRNHLKLKKSFIFVKKILKINI